jgi:hypothetical protein
VKKT